MGEMWNRGLFLVELKGETWKHNDQLPFLSVVPSEYVHVLPSLSYGIKSPAHRTLVRPRSPSELLSTLVTSHVHKSAETEAAHGTLDGCQAGQVHARYHWGTRLLTCVSL